MLHLKQLDEFDTDFHSLDVVAATRCQPERVGHLLCVVPYKYGMNHAVCFVHITADALESTQEIFRAIPSANRSLQGLMS